MEFSRPEYWNGQPFPSPGGSFLTQGSNLGLPHCRETLYRLSYHGSTFTHFKKILCSLSFSKIIVFKREKQKGGPKQLSDYREACVLC